MNSLFFPKEKLKRSVEWAHHNIHSSFYKKRLAKIIKEDKFFSYEVWNNIPLLKREEITGVPFWKRTFVPRHKVPIIRHTYGTSGARILITPRVLYGNYKDPYKTMGMGRMMSFFASFHTGYPRENIDMEIQTWFGDVGNLEISAKIATKARIDSLSITPYTAIVFAPLLKKYYPLINIKVVMITGERCSPLQFKKIHELYPSAISFTSYATSETREIIALPCIHSHKKNPFTLTPVREVYCEIINPESNFVIEDYGVAGELVITTLTKKIPFPLIRYRTGDIAMYKKRNCSCQKNIRSFEVLGRSTIFPVRMTKGELTVEAVEKALRAIPEISPEYFEAYCSEEKSNNLVLPRVSLVLVKKHNTKIKKIEIARKISNTLFVFPTYTYAQGVQERLYLPLTVSFIKKVPGHSLGKPKQPIIARHISAI